MCNLYEPKPDNTGGRGKGKRGMFRLAHHMAIAKRLHTALVNIKHGINFETESIDSGSLAPNSKPFYPFSTRSLFLSAKTDDRTLPKPSFLMLNSIAKVTIVRLAERR